MIYILLRGNPHFACFAASEKKVKEVVSVNKSL